MALAPWLVLAVGNPSRGDDALGPMLLDRLVNAGVGDDGEVELLTDFQLQVEHALDLFGRRGVLFVDAARPGVVDGARVELIEADASVPVASHALSPQAVLCVARQMAGPTGAVPPAWLLAIEGESFELGAALSAAAERHLDLACDQARAWLRARSSADQPAPSAMATR